MSCTSASGSSTRRFNSSTAIRRIARRNTRSTRTLREHGHYQSRPARRRPRDAHARADRRPAEADDRRAREADPAAHRGGVARGGRARGVDHRRLSGGGGEGALRRWGELRGGDLLRDAGRAERHRESDRARARLRRWGSVRARLRRHPDRAVELSPPRRAAPTIPKRS